MRAPFLSSTTRRSTTLVVSSLLALAVFGWVVASYQPSPAERAVFAARERPLPFQAELAARAGDPALAARIQRRWLKSNPDYAAGWAALARFATAAGQQDLAQSAWSRAAQLVRDWLDRNPTRFEGWSELAEYLESLGDRDEAALAWSRAAESLRQYLSEDSASPGELSRLARLLDRAGRHDEARQTWLAAAQRLEQNLNDGQSTLAELRRLASLLDQAGRHDQALQAARQAADAWEQALRRHAPRPNADPGSLRRSATGWFELARYCERVADDPDRARTAWLELRQLAEQRIADQPDSLTGWYHLGWACRGLGDLAAATQAWQTLLARYQQRLEHPLQPRQAFDLARYRALVGDLDGALDALEQARDAGWLEPAWLVHDPDLEPVRSHPRFARLLAELDPTGLLGAWPGDDPAADPRDD